MRTRTTLVSSFALALALSGPGFSQQSGAADALPEGLRDQIDRLREACEAGGDDALAALGLGVDGLTCDRIAAGEAAGDADANAGTDPATAPGVATEEPETAGGEDSGPDAAALERALGVDAEAAAATEAEAGAEAEAEVEAAPEAEAAAEAEAEGAAEADAAEEDRTEAEAEALERALAEEEAEAEAGPAPGDAQREDEGAGPARPGAAAATGIDQPAPDRDAAPQAPGNNGRGVGIAPAQEVATAEDPADIAPADSEAQAEAIAEAEADAPAAAAAAADSAGVEVTEEQVTEDEVRRSSEDFATDARGSTAQGEDEDDDRDNTLRNLALLGLGAVALNEILGADERVVSNSGDRIVVERDGQLRVLRNDDVLLRRPGAEVQTYRFDDGSTRQVVTYADGTSVETVRTADGRVLRRTRTLADGTEFVLFDDTQDSEAVDVATLPEPAQRTRTDLQSMDADRLAAALAAAEDGRSTRRFSLNQVRNIDAVRQLVPEITVDNITFETGSAAIRPSEARELADLGAAMRRLIERNPAEVFLVEGHTDAVGSAGYNLALSDRRAESVALALTEYFDVPPENMVLQGYGEADLLIPTLEAERQNRRAAVRRITPLLR